MDEKDILITAAGGNGTAIRVIKHPLTRSQYETLGKKLGNEKESLGAEQAGFLVLDDWHFEMAGGEFCGNATRSAAILFSEASGKKDVSFTVSGFDGIVNGEVEQLSDHHFFVRCTFSGMNTDIKLMVLSDGKRVAIVDLGGIVHVVIEDKFPSDPKAYNAIHRSITRELKLGNREAVGVIWFEKTENDAIMHPVVWVKAVDTFFYEESCGSGSIAVGRVGNISSIVQPTGKIISVKFTKDIVVLESEMEVIHVEG